MYINIDPIHTGPVVLAQGFAIAARAPTPADDSKPAKSRDRAVQRQQFRPLRHLAQWWRQLDQPHGARPDAEQLMLWSECAGRHYTTALCGFLLMNHFQGKQMAPKQECSLPR